MGKQDREACEMQPSQKPGRPPPSPPGSLQHGLSTAQLLLLLGPFQEARWPSCLLPPSVQ